MFTRYFRPQTDAEKARILAIQARWRECRPSHRGTPYAVQPSLTAPFSPGKLAPGFVRDGVNMVNFHRFVAGLPADVDTDEALMLQAQSGALLMAALGHISHSPERPAEMPESLYRLGRSAAGSSNLGQGYESIADSIRSYMDDSDPSNIDRLGHRRWILNPPLLKTAFGFVTKSRYESFTVTQVFDRSRTKSPAYTSIAWPAAGMFPVEFFGKTQAWSITLNPELYQTPAVDSVRVVLRRLARGTAPEKEWRFGAGATKTPGDYYNLETSGFGVNNCLIFRPGGISAYALDDRFDVTVTGLKTGTGRPAEPLSYSVAFFPLGGQ